jgi:hypothetical protein
MAGRLAIIAGDGVLPLQIAAIHKEALVITLAGVPHQFDANPTAHRLEKLGGLFEALRAAAVSHVVFAGALARPRLDPVKFDPVTLDLGPKLQAALRCGDNELLSQVIDIFEQQGFLVVGAQELLPDLTAQAGLHIGPEPDAGHLADIERAWGILQALSPHDVGQGCVMAGGQCLAVETVQGTDFMLKYMTDTAQEMRRNGVFVKAAKRGQDLRIDMPSIGPETIAAVVAAGLDGMAIEAGKVLILEREKTLQAIENAGIFLIAREF